MNGADDFLIGKVNAFFLSGSGPTHRSLTEVFDSLGIGDGYRYDPNGRGQSKQDRIRRAFRACRKDQEKTIELVSKLITQLRLHGDLDDDNSPLRYGLIEALKEQGWSLTLKNTIERDLPVDLAVASRPALEEQLARINKATDDPGLMLGTAKDLIEAIYKFTLEEIGVGAPKNAAFNHLQHLALERLGMLPHSIDTDLPGGKQLRQIYQTAQTQAQIVNELRNEQGTGHGRTLPTGVSTEAAIFVIRQAGLLAEMLLFKLDQVTAQASVKLKEP